MNQRLHLPWVVVFLLLAFAITLNACSINKVIPLHSKTTEIANTALLITPIEIDLIYHNGKKVDLLPAYQKKVKYRLPAGEHWLGFQYQDIHYDDDENQEIITSKKVFIHYNAIAGYTYHITFDAPKNYTEAKLLESNLQLKLSLGNTVIAKSASNQPVATFMEPNVSLKTAPRAIKPSSAVEHLKHWWTEASSEERQTFIQWTEN